MVLIAGTDAQMRVRRDIGVDHAVQDEFLVVQAVDETIAFLIFGHDPPAHGAIGGDGRTDVAHDEKIVPAACRSGQRSGQMVAVGMFAHQIDRSRRVANAGQQASGTAHDFDLLVEDDVQIGFARAEPLVPLHRDAVDLIDVDIEAARRKAVARTVQRLDRNARRIVHHVAQRSDQLILHTLCRHHRDRLGRLLNAQAQSCR